MKSPNDAWNRVVRKVAGDVVHRLFESFGDEELASERRLTKELFIRCFQKGKSSTRKLKGITNWGDTHVGREIQVTNDKEENEKILTAHLFNKPIPVIIKDNQCFSSYEEYKRSKFLFRHSFEHERSSCVHPIDPIEANKFLVADQRENLLLAKEKIEKELAYKFKSSDEKIITTLKEVFIEELENKVTTSLDKTDKKIDQVSEQIENVAHGIGAQEDMLSQIFMILKQMQESEEK